MNPERYRLLEEARRSLPDGYKVELSGDVIVMQASPSSVHQLNLALVQRQFEAHCPPGYFPTGNSDLSSPEVGSVRNPDLTYLPEDVIDLAGHDIPAELALIAVEIVSRPIPRTTGRGRSATTRAWASRSI
ncbi:Uma2 family endonuclease [Kitasatospora sp. NPDC059811]|uniref:Uma2 family endonuclease n=1 Tax=Streptomycetaceae TaxID=2062 RepID=UPI000A67D286|nr:Uma2 family endonuclease [Streptomyces sp. MJM8645]